MPAHTSLVIPDTANAGRQSRINISIIFNYLRDHGPAYRAQISRDLGLSAPAVSRAVEKLRAEECVVESERTPVNNGRRATRLSINSDRGLVLGIDLLADPVEIAISDFAGSVLFTYTGRARAEGADHATGLLESIDECLSAFQTGAPGRKWRILAIGIGVPAVVDPRTGTVLRGSLYEDLGRLDVRAAVQRRFPVPVYMENVSNIAAIGEWKRGANRNIRNMLFLEIGNGIGAGIILEGNLYRGAEGAAGEIGYFLTELAGLDYERGALGYLETKASLSALRETVLEAGRGNAAARESLRVMVQHLAIATVNIMLLLDPEIVIVGGEACELPDAEELFLRPLMDAVQRAYPFAPAPLHRSSLGSRANIVGAVQFALDSLLVDEYPYRL